MAIMKEAKTLTFGDTQYVVVDAEAREKIAELEQSANETLPALKQQIETHSSDNNAHSDIRDAIPTKVSQLANDSQFITQESDPTVPSWAKQETKPEYTASEVGAEPAGTSSTVVSQHNTSNVAHADIRNEVKALNDEFASHEHNNAYDSKGSAESALTEAKSYTNSKTANLASNASVSTSVNNHNTNAEAHNDIRLELKAINDRLNAFFDSDDKTLDELSEIVAYITNNKTLIDSITTSKVNVEDIINNLTTNVANKPLSAAQGVALKGLIDSVSTSLSSYQPKGNYALKSELPTKVSQLSNDSGYLTEHQDISGKLDSSALPTAINTALAQAKASGAFDGIDGSDYVLTESDKQEIAEQAARLVEVPEGGGGLTVMQINALDGMFKIAAYTENAEAAYTAFKVAFGIVDDEPTIPDEPDEPEVTLTSISAAYSGGDVAVGTAVTDLTGIVVTATYSDGSTATVTGYTLSGAIAEGENAVTVTHNGMSTIFIVTGVAESSGEDVEPLYTLESAENYTVNSRYSNTTATLTVSDGNHIQFTHEAQTSNEWYWDVNISSLATYGQAVASVADTLFAVPAGATVKLCTKNLSYTKGTGFSLRINLGSVNSIHSNYAVVSGDIETYEFTFTTDSDVDVPCVTMSVMPVASALIEVECDFELYVNEVRWI